ncbi:rab11 family-interacting protein 1-like isoform X1 [Sinocyclocheilus anshuiensis]|uniref:rab11 family-interacting protein 1-like isoform X1 n=1 Tax=Sinocyclocheilus anshuiensis TaxID=1608454 RepID=UPI0007B92A61|nr:PREDICTED: rab11 family-interacting protein 1-like isoform X1 [Sinocyclocheilus anshuiensis]
MSLAEQSQQWFPTSVQVTVLQARGLRSKGKNGTNDAYAIMQVAKDKFSTSVAEKSVVPVWKEEAAFDLPLFHPSNAERFTLQVCVMHRALVGPDKMLGQATINLLELQDNKSRNKTEWFKLMGKTGKADKDRGEVLLDVQFMKNNMTASMYDLSGQDKSRSRLGKIKDKLKGKKKNGMSDSASAIVPSVGQVLTDSEGEEEPDATPGAKKKNKLKSLFAPKPGLHRNISQSMSTLATLPEKDSPISLSRSSGLNIESPEVKQKFKFLKHKRTGSSDSKVSQGTGSLGLGMVQSNMCINGSHVYTEEPETRGSRAGSTFSLNSSGHGSMEDLRRGHDRKTSSTSMDSSDQTQDNAVEEMRRRQEEQRKHEEEVRKRLEEERRQAEEEERKQLEREQEEERKRLEREEEKRKLQKLEEERKRIEREEERKRIEKEEERKRIEREEERKRIEREEERKLLEREEERKRIEIEEERNWMEREEEKRKLEKQEEERRIEEEERERKRIKQEEIIRIKKEQERVRQEEERRKAEEERIKEEKRKRMEEEEKARKEEDKRRRIEEEKRTRLENEKLQKEEETRKLEMDRRRAEEDERLLKEKEKMEAEEKRKRKEEEERRLSEEMERKEQERVRQEKEKLELANKRIEERMREEQVRRKAEEEEEKRKLKEKADEERIRQEKEEMERQKKEKEQRPEVKPRSARLNTSKKASDEINSDHILFTNPFEDPLLFDESSTNPFEQPNVSQPEGLSRSTKVSAVKPSSSVSGIFFSQASVPNTNPFLDDSDVHGGNTEKVVHLGDTAERSEKKRRAPMPPQNKTQKGKPDVPPKAPAIPEATQAFPSRASEDDGDSDSCSLQREKRPAPLPSKNKQEVQNTHADQTTTPLHTGEWRTTRFQEIDQTNEVCPVLQDESRTSDAANFGNTSLSHLIQGHPSNRQETNPFISTEVKTTKHDKGPAPKPSLQSKSCKTSASESETSKQAISNVHLTEHETSAASNSCIDQIVESTDKLDDLPADEEPSTKPEHSEDLFSRESKHKDLPEKSKLDSLGEDIPSMSDPVLGKVFYNVNDPKNAENVLLESGVSKKKSRAPLPPAKSASSQQPEAAPISTSQPSIQDQVKSLTVNSSKSTSCFTQSLLNSSSTSSQALAPLKLEAGHGSEERSLPQARVSPIDVQPVAEQKNGSENERTGDPGFKPCRPHAVKPLSTTDKQPDLRETHDASRSAKITDDMQVKMKAPEAKGTGPYSQLTHEELINLLEKQKQQLSQKDAKIGELELYIDSLLVRVMEESPNILMSLSLMKKSF